jgi:hypothetical protein
LFIRSVALVPERIADPGAYEDTDQYRPTRSFLEAPERFFRHLLD